MLGLWRLVPLVVIRGNLLDCYNMYERQHRIDSYG